MDDPIAFRGDPDPDPVPAHLRRRSSTASRPDLDPENDPLMPSPTSPGAAPQDSDTCRICRAEGTPEEPLFYPCKCSGSIKYVHQNCLMEWLSHSQKKHCELCKTSFRFTKLYSPDMPQRLPVRVFATHVAKYLFGNLLVWLRLVLVCCVWLGWLPYTMRLVWSSVFWLSDFGIGGSPPPPLAPINFSSGICPATVVPATCPADPFLAAASGIMSGRSSVSSSTIFSIYGINITATDPALLATLRLLFSTVGLGDDPASTNAEPQRLFPTPRHGTLLSNVTFLKNLTSWSLVNDTFIAIFEGQIITILVVICFILIILVRDYVVQQQPEINMRAAFADAAADNREHDAPAAPFPAPHPVAEPRVADGADGILGQGLHVEDDVHPMDDVHDVGQEGEGDEENAPARDNERELGHATVQDYLRIYRAADGDPEAIMRMIREEHLDDRLQNWVRLTQAIEDRNRQAERMEHDNLESNHGTVADSSAAHSPREQEENSSGAFNPTSTWAWPDELPEDVQRQDKGKSRAEVDDDEDDWDTRTPSGSTDSMAVQFTPAGESTAPQDPLRRRAISDSRVDWDVMSSHLDNDSTKNISNARLQRDGAPADHSDEGDQPAPFTAPGPDEDEGTGIDLANPENNGEPHETAVDPPEINEEPVAPRAQPNGFIGRVVDFMWGPVEALEANEPLPNDPNAQVVINEIHQMLDLADDDIAEGDDEAALDQDAIEDAEDFEGIMELFGMRGPLFGLFQNALFCALLVSVTILLAVFLPYNIGRISLWITANPYRVLQIFFACAKFAQDLVLAVVGGVCFMTLYVFEAAINLLPIPLPFLTKVVNESFDITKDAGTRVVDTTLSELSLFSHNEVNVFSSLSHEALCTVKKHAGTVISTLAAPLVAIISEDPSTRAAALESLSNTALMVWETAKSLPSSLADPTNWVLNMTIPILDPPVPKPELVYWNGTDRFWAILYGYIAMTVVAGLYLSRGRPLTQGWETWEASLIDGLNQASGVMKVILIISIEMLIFPLYCGLLLDLALMPLFANTSLASRINFTVTNPLTSIFVHWFVGTGYMFHFALFVSMCRKIMRKGVLYFIRDPDDPEFHPVRDVLERSVTTQLRKILFSAFVYGALVMVCLGGVVWGLWLAIPSVLPIHYSSNEPVLEFPIDLLFYNFLMPLAVRFFKPSDGLHAMYTWWFRKCARALRITWFLFGERKIDEEGMLQLAEDSEHTAMPVWKQFFLELDDKTNAVVPKTWRDTFDGGKAKPNAEIKPQEMVRLNQRKLELVSSKQLVKDGMFVRTPCSDQVKIPKGRKVFMEVDEDNSRLDGQRDVPDTDLYSNKDQYQLVYIPPHFRVRVFLFILFIWLFAAVTGVGFTIIPLVFGRRLFRAFLPDHVRTNDIYAFSIGIYVLGSACYCALKLRALWQRTKAQASTALAKVDLRRVANSVLYSAKLSYAYIVLLVYFPLLTSTFMELYVIIPLHTCMYPSPGSELAPAGADAVTGETARMVQQMIAGGGGKHTVHIVQSWTLGLVYLKLLSRFMVQHYEGTRVAAAVRAVLRRGWLDPDVGVLTRAFVLPSVALVALGIAGPAIAARVIVGWAEGLMRDAEGMHGVEEGERSRTAGAYRMAYPLAAIFAMGLLVGYRMTRMVKLWRTRIRDEVYLVGERLHNFSSRGRTTRVVAM